MEKKEAIYHLQLIDCNCNDCCHLQRLSDRLNEAIANDRASQEIIFDATKERKINKTLDDIENIRKHRLLIKNADKKIHGKEEYLKLLHKKTFHYQGQQTQTQYGRCLKFERDITFIPNTCQLETQKCFTHRKDLTKN